jgi:Fe-Mn family superoxide dismutase
VGDFMKVIILFLSFVIFEGVRAKDSSEHLAEKRTLWSKKALPYAEDALEPYLNKKVLNSHYHGHYFQYVDTLNKNLVSLSIPWDGDARHLIRFLFGRSHRKFFSDDGLKGPYRMASQAFNHEFFFDGLSPNPSGQLRAPSKDFQELLMKQFQKESFSAFLEYFCGVANQQFGSAWVWLITTQSGKMRIQASPNEGGPLIRSHEPLFVIDMWEHSYYTQYGPDRKAYIKAVMSKLINWDKVEKRYLNVIKSKN